MKAGALLWIQRALWVVAFWLIAESLAPSVIHSASPQTQGTRIVINVSQRRLYLYRGSELLGDYPVAVGKPNTRSPRGEFVITQKAVWGDGFGTRWMRISVPWGIYGIHGTNKPWTVGTVASHGCFRMYNRDVEKVYDLVSVGTPVTIEGPTPYAQIRRPMRAGQLGQDVVELQRLLRLAGVYPGRLEGVYTAEVSEAVKRFQAMVGLEVTGNADLKTAEKLAEYTHQDLSRAQYL